MMSRARPVPQHPARLEDLLRVGRRPERQRLVPRLRHRPRVPRAGQERVSEQGAGGPAGGRQPQGLRAAGLRPARRGAARRRAGGEAEPRRATSSSTTRATTPATRSGPTAATPRRDSDSNTVDALIKSLRENNYDATQLRPEGPALRQRAQRLRRARLGVAQRHARPRPGRPPARQAHQPRRARSGSAGAPTASGTARRRPRSSRCGASSSPSAARSCTACPTGSRATSRTRLRKAKRPERTIRNAILGRNAARAYEIDPDERRHEIDCDDGQRRCASTATSRTPGTERESAPLASNQIHGPRTRRELIENMRGQPWSP